MDDDSRLETVTKNTAVAGLGLVALFGLYILVYLTIHVWVSAHALTSSGQLASLLTFCLPVLGDAYWGIRQWIAEGPTTFAVTATIGAILGLLSYPLQSFGSRWVQRSRGEMLQAIESLDNLELDELEDLDLLDRDDFDDSDDDEPLSPKHLEVLRHVHLGWNDCESGAPSFHPERPFGDGDFWETLCQLTDSDDREDAAEVWRGMDRAWEAFIERVTLEPGRYPIRSVASGNSAPVTSINVSDEMLTLARALGEDIDWEEEHDVPGPSCDPKRPYGDYTNYPIDMARALGWDDRIDTSGEYDELSEADDDYLSTLHHTSMLPTMQAILQHGRL